jgi:hypothetical protein
MLCQQLLVEDSGGQNKRQSSIETHEGDKTSGTTETALRQLDPMTTTHPRASDNSEIFSSGRTEFHPQRNGYR